MKPSPLLTQKKKKNYKMRQMKCDSYFKIKYVKSLLKNASVFLQNVTVLLAKVTFVTKCDNFFIKCVS